MATSRHFEELLLIWRNNLSRVAFSETCCVKFNCCTLLRIVQYSRMDIYQIIKEAKEAKNKESLESYTEAISVLREKGYSWRDISDFLADRGVKADHTKIYRFHTKLNSMKGKTMSVITSEEYQAGLEAISLSKAQLMMLKAHYNAVNRSITYTELAKSADFKDWKTANLQYGKLGRALGEEVGFAFVDASPNRPDELFYSSSIGQINSYTSGDFQLVMHHELAKAIEALKMF